MNDADRSSHDMDCKFVLPQNNISHAAPRFQIPYSIIQQFIENNIHKTLMSQSLIPRL